MYNIDDWEDEFCTWLAQEYKQVFVPLTGFERSLVRLAFQWAAATKIQEASCSPKH